MTESLN